MLDRAGLRLPRGLRRRLLRRLRSTAASRARGRGFARSTPAARRRSRSACAAASSSARGRSTTISCAASSGAPPRAASTSSGSTTRSTTSSNLVSAAEAVKAAGKEVVVGLVHNPGPGGESDELVERARAGRRARRDAHHRQRSGRLARRGPRACARRAGAETRAGCRSASTARAPRAARWRRRSRAPGAARSPIACTIYPVAITLYRPSAEALVAVARRHRARHGVDVADALGGLRARRRGARRHAGPAADAARRGPRRRAPALRRARLDARRPPARIRPRDRLDEVLEELLRVQGGVRLAAARLADREHPRLAGAAPRALRPALAGRRRRGAAPDRRARTGTPPRPVDPLVRRAVELLGDGRRPRRRASDLDELREAARGLATSEEELLAARALRRGGRAAAAHDPRPGARRGARARRASTSRRRERIRELIELVQESGIGEVTIEEGEMRVTVRRSEERMRRPRPRRSPRARRRARARPGEPPRQRVVRIESPMVGVFYRAPAPGARAVRRGRRHGRRRADALPARGDEALQRGQGRVGRDRPRDPRRERAAGRVRPAPVRARACPRPTARRGLTDAPPAASGMSGSLAAGAGRLPPSGFTLSPGIAHVGHGS